MSGKSSSTAFIRDVIVVGNSLSLNGWRLSSMVRKSFLTTQQHVLLDTSTGDYDVNSLTISVRDKDGNLFDLRTFARKSSNIDFFIKLLL